MAKQKKDSASEKEEQKLSEEDCKKADKEPKEAEKEEKDSKKAEKMTAESETDKLQKDLAAAKEAHIRTLAEYDNYRKRSTKEKQAAYGDAKADCIKELLPMMDNFERALAAEATDVEGFKKGVEMIFKSFGDVLSKLGVEAFGEKGEKFDPNIHNGVMHVEDEELPENSVAEVFSKGYKLGDRILRPAMVKVAN